MARRSHAIALPGLRVAIRKPTTGNMRVMNANATDGARLPVPQLPEFSCERVSQPRYPPTR